MSVVGLIIVLSLFIGRLFVMCCQVVKWLLQGCIIELMFKRFILCSRKGMMVVGRFVLLVSFIVVIEVLQYICLRMCVNMLLFMVLIQFVQFLFFSGCFVVLFSFLCVIIWVVFREVRQLFVFVWFVIVVMLQLRFVRIVVVIELMLLVVLVIKIGFLFLIIFWFLSVIIVSIVVKFVVLIVIV